MGQAHRENRREKSQYGGRDETPGRSPGSSVRPAPSAYGQGSFGAPAAQVVLHYLCKHREPAARAGPNPETAATDPASLAMGALLKATADPRTRSQLVN